ncbi:MAG TPA: periplasmic heavy metal sensor [Acetobacteraceae bacterium]|nr:periplasmic heavy metal sensor [Acetobacteraceae bacterium]
MRVTALPDSRPSRRIAVAEWWRFGLWASLALNAFLLALLAARLLAPPPPHHGPPDVQRVIARMAATLPPEDAARFRSVMTGRAPALQAAQDRLRAAHRTAAAAIGAVPFRAADAEAAMAAFRAAWLDLARQLGQALVVAAGDLSPQGRARLAAFGETPRNDHE